eukprot:351582-Chlamydomonas_euryale.AAC.3
MKGSEWDGRGGTKGRERDWEEERGGLLLAAHLHRLAQVIAAPFALDHVLVDLSRRDVVVLGKRDVQEPAKPRARRVGIPCWPSGGVKGGGICFRTSC